MKKITSIFFLAAAFALVLSASTTLKNNVAQADAVPENTFALCHDGLDNDDSLAADMSDPNCAAFPLTAENTYALCHDGLDNDMNLSDDESDPSCSAFVPVTENTFALCHDGIDNDFNLASDMSDANCSAFPLVTENTYALCHDGLDNDMNLTSDESDPSCAAFVPVAENTALLCNDGIDNDFDLSIDLSDSGCAAFAPVATTTEPIATTTPVAPVSNPGSTETGGQQTGGGGITSFFTTGRSTGTVLGASTDDATTTGATCSAVLVEYMKMGKKNTSTEVKKLQAALNLILGTKLPITGYFGASTDAAVRQLQSKYSAQILAPWVNLKLMKVQAPTGYVYKTTQWYINTQLCTGMNIPAPILP